MKLSWVSTIVILVLTSIAGVCQPDRWQQAGNYMMNIDFDVNTHQFSGTQTLEYTNNSPDELEEVFYHLYFNAFQPGSMMDVRNRTLPDPDPRVGERISKLNEKEIGYLRAKSVSCNGAPATFEEVGTILEVQLAEPIQPGQTVTLYMEFDGQVPLQIRRSGRDNKEGISYSMSQWYPKLCEYDYQGWHANPYVGREFYGIWGDFDVTINIDESYIVGGTGYLQNPEQIGYGYGKDASMKKGNAAKEGKISWRFLAPNVHDFMWAADPDYTHTRLDREDGLTLHFYYQKDEKTEEYWALLPHIMDEAFNYINQRYGAYPYKQYSFVQGGDGGMEYPMGTLITGVRSLPSLVGVSVHELMHSWYQMMLGTNEALYAWMDEGFTSWASAEVMNHLRSKGLVPGNPSDNPYANTYRGYINLVESGLEEPLTTHADHFATNYAYGQAAYTKGSVFIRQLEYVIGKEALDQGILDYFETWKYKHPNTNDFIRVMEKASGLELDWYKEHMVFSTRSIDYSVALEEGSGKKTTKVVVENQSNFPMPIDLVVTLKNGEELFYYIPLRVMRGEKGVDLWEGKINQLTDWPWTHPTYEFEIPVKAAQIVSVEIDPSQRLADVNPKNNRIEGAAGEKKRKKKQKK